MMRSPMRYRSVVVLALILAPSRVPAAEPPAPSSSTVRSVVIPSPGRTPNSSVAAPATLLLSNGLTVSDPKIYEERSLRLMLQAAEQRLASIGVIDAASIARSVGTVQGGRESFSDISLTASTLPTPQVTNDVTNTQSATPSTVQKTTTTQGPVTPQGPPATTFPAGFGPSLGLQPTIGLSARDLLAEQVALTYQIANLRLALERAASDRFIEGTSRNGNTFSFQRQAILLGFQVSVDSPSSYRGGVAEVRVALDFPGENPISLVTLLPTRDTYNVAAITRKSRSIGAGAILQVFQLGAGFRWGRGTYYLVQDADTLGLQFPSSNSSKLTFGWQFRPVLGRKAVDSGLRQVYALITLPVGLTVTQPVTGKVETRWRKWDSNRQTVGLEIPGSAEARGLILSPATFTSLDTKLAPGIDHADWIDLGSDRALVVVEGKNFFTDTQVAVGDTFLDRTNGLQIPDEGRLVFTTSLKSLAMSRDASVVGRYTGRIPLAMRFKLPTDPPALVSLNSFAYLGYDLVHLTLSASGFGAKTRPIVVIGDIVFGGREHPLKIIRAVDGVITGFELDAPLSLVRTAQRAVARDIFGGDELYAESPLLLADDFTATKVVTLAKRKEGPLLAIMGSNFDQRMIVEVAGQEIAGTPVGELPSSLLTFAPTLEQIRGVDQVVVRRKGAKAPPALLLLNPSPEVKKPQFAGSIKIPLGFSQLQKFPGTDLDSVAKVTFEGETLESRLSDKGASIEVKLTTHVTGLPGPKALELQLIDSSVVLLPFEVIKP